MKNISKYLCPIHLNFLKNVKLFPKLCFLQILDPTMRNDANRMKDKPELKTGNNIDGTNLRIKLVYWCQGLIKKPAQLGPQYSAHIEIEGKRAASNWLNVCDAPFDVWHYMVEHYDDKQIYLPIRYYFANSRFVFDENVLWE